MRRVVQSRVGDTGTCFRSCLAAIFNLRESDVPDFPQANQDPAVDRWLGAQYGLRYVQVPISSTATPPVGWHIIEGISPRGGQHAVVGYNGQYAWDPHPQDGTGRYLAQPEYWGLLVPALAKDAYEDKFRKVYKNKKTMTGVATCNYHLGKKCAECGGPVNNAARPGARCQGCLVEGGHTDVYHKSEGKRIRAAILKAAEKERAAKDAVTTRPDKDGEMQLSYTAKDKRTRLHRALDAVMDRKKAKEQPTWQ